MAIDPSTLLWPSVGGFLWLLFFATIYYIFEKLELVGGGKKK